MNQKKLKQIAERWKGKSGGPEAETTIADSKNGQELCPCLVLYFRCCKDH